MFFLEASWLIFSFNVHSLPNLLTLSRIPFLFAVAGLLYGSFFGASFLAFIFFVLGSLTDWLDGFLARRYGLVSKFGKLMDALTDKVFVVGICIVCLATGVLPAWSIACVLLIVAREFFVTGLRLVAATQGCVIAAERAGKLKTIIQMTSLGVLLAVHAFRKEGLGVFGLDFLNGVNTIGLALFIGATVLTVCSGIGYLIKYGYLLKDSD